MFGYRPAGRHNKDVNSVPGDKSRSQHRSSFVRRQDRWVLTCGAAGGLLVLFVLLPLASTVLGTSASAVWAALNETEVRQSLWLTFCAGAVATVLVMVSGVPLAFVLARYQSPGREIVQGLIDLPVVIPHTAAGIALLMVFGRRGLVGRLALAAGVRFTGSIPGIVAAMLFVSLPFLVNAARDAFGMIDPELEAMARVEGANGWQAFRHLTLPLAARGIIGGAVMMWARGISEFGAVVILAYHPQIVPVLLFERFEGFGLNAAQPVAVILIATSLIVFALLRPALIRRSAVN